MATTAPAFLLLSLLILLNCNAAPAWSYSDKKAMELDNLAFSASGSGDAKKEEQLYRQALAIRSRKLKHNDPRVIRSIEMVAVSCREGHKYKQAERLYNQALTLWRTLPASSVVGKDRDEIADNREGLAIVFTEAGQNARAAAIYKDMVARREKTMGPKDGSVAISLRAYADVLTRMNKTKEANALFEKADKIMPNLCGTPALNQKDGKMPPPPPGGPVGPGK